MGTATARGELAEVLTMLGELRSAESLTTTPARPRHRPRLLTGMQGATRTHERTPL